MKTGLALGGGGSKGAYEVGVWKALIELDIHFDIVTGTSIGSLNGSMVVQGEYEKCLALWQSLTIDDVIAGGVNLDFDIELMMAQKERLPQLIESYVTHGGADISPFLKVLERMFNAEAFFASSIDYGCMCTDITHFKPRGILKQEMNADTASQYLLASASCFPVFPIQKVEDIDYIDGGFCDNVPIELARDMGAEKIIAVDLRSVGRNAIKGIQPDVTYIQPLIPLGSFLSFNQKTIEHNIQLGYLDGLRILSAMPGYVYTFNQASREHITAFEERMQEILKDSSLLEQSLIDKLYRSLLDYQIRIPWDAEYICGRPHLRMLELLGYLFEIEYLKIWSFEDFKQELFDNILYYEPSYTNPDQGMMEEIKKLLVGSMKKDSVYYLYSLLEADNITLFRNIKNAFELEAALAEFLYTVIALDRKMKQTA